MEESARELPSMGDEPSVADRIASALGEQDELPKSQIRQLAVVLGEPKVLELLSETQRVEQSGGMLVPDGSRRRTPGGVFFYLARGQLTRQDRRRIFGPPPDSRSSGAEPREAEPPKSAPQPSRQPPRPVEAQRPAPPRPIEPPRSGVVTVTNGARQRRIVEVETVRRRVVTAEPQGAAQLSFPDPAPQKPEASPQNGASVQPLNGGAPPRVRRIVTIADVKGKAEPPVTNGVSSALADPEPALHRIPPGVSFDPKSLRRKAQEAPKQLPADRVRDALVGCDPTERPRVLLEVLLEELENLPPTRGAVRLNDRVVAIAAAKLKIPVNAIARALFGDESDESQSQVEAIVDEGLDMGPLERLFTLLQERSDED